jgi:cellulose synthase/poly-beta-1,6-N-acetylglucosamine synthase-like glycosyltransferase
VAVLPVDLRTAFLVAGCAVFALLTGLWLWRLGVAGRYLLEWADYGAGAPVATAPAGEAAGAPGSQRHGPGVRPPAVCILVPVLEETGRLESCVRALLEMGRDLPDYTVAIITTEAEFARHERTTANLLNLVRSARSIEEVGRLMVCGLPPAAEVADPAPSALPADLQSYRAVALEILGRRPTTIDLAQALAERFPRVRVYHKAGPGGHMAHQLNSGLRAHLASTGSAEIVFGLYNADSRPDPRTLAWVLERWGAPFEGAFGGLPFEGAFGGGLRLFQQYGLYLANQAAILRTARLPARAVLSAAGAWQTRWSLGFEIFNALRQFPGRGRAVRAGRFRLGRLPVLNYCIGHGLFFAGETYERLGGFSEETYNEDAMFGLAACHQGLPIVPVPFLEASDSPESLRSLYIQKSTWFWGPLQAFRYRELILREQAREAHSPRRASSGGARAGSLDLRLTWLTIQLFEHAIAWMAGPTLMAVLLGLALCARDPLHLALVAGAVGSYLVLPNLVALAICRRAVPEVVVGLDLGSEALRQVLGAPVVYALHGLSAYRTLGRALRSWALGLPAPKERTPLKGQAPV